MGDRRRSERRAIALPVWIKDARGGERTTTADVSAHGLAVFSEEPRPQRQYVELEIELPESEVVIAVTAMVARRAALVDPSRRQRTGMGLEFFLFDVRSKSRWQAFLHNYFGPSQGFDAGPPAEVEEVPAFLIRPRDVGRLWAFFRGELNRAQVRIESAVAKPPGTVVELLVVHPDSGAEWILDGEVLIVTPSKRGGQSILEIGLPGLDIALKEAFRGFIVSGLGQIQEEISMSVSAEMPNDLGGPDAEEAKVGEPERIESVVIEFEELETLGLFEDEEPTMTATEDDVAQAERIVEPMPSERTTDGRGVPELGDSPSSVFASFFEEAAEADAIEPEATELSASYLRPVPAEPPVPDRVAVSIAGISRIVDPTTNRAEGPLAARAEGPLAARAEGPLAARAEGPTTEALDGPPIINREPPPLPKTVNARPRLIAHNGNSVVHVDRRRLDQTQGIRVRPALQADPLAGEPELVQIDVAGFPRGRPAVIGDAKENLRADHVSVSTAGTDPGLDREIAMARARVVRSPNDIEASLVLSHLLSARGDSRLVDEAIDVVRKVTALVPNHPLAHHRLAELFARKGDYRLARAHLGEAKRLGYQVDPDLERVVAEGARAQ